MKKSNPPADATTQIVLGGAEDPGDVSLDESDVDLSPGSFPAGPRMTAPPPLPMSALVSTPTLAQPDEPKPRYAVYGLVLLAFFAASVAGAALWLRATTPRSAPAASASVVPSARPAVITIQPVDMNAP